jgi:hypothetical protein
MLKTLLEVDIFYLISHFFFLQKEKVGQKGNGFKERL